MGMKESVIKNASLRNGEQKVQEGEEANDEGG